METIMNMGADSWLTLSEVIHKSNFSDIEGRRLIKKFGTYLAPRNFGDIIKYPPAAVDAIILISELYRQGCSTEEITTILSQSNNHPQESLQEQLQQEVGTLLKLQNQACQLMRTTFEMVQNLMADVATLTAKLAAAEEEIHTLKEENQTYRAAASGNKLEKMN
jgi:DNA-binding transcriptional MerR regulator